MPAGTASAADWSQWRGANGDANVPDFTPPKSWPKEPARKWRSRAGDGVATPALVGDKLYVFARQGDQEVATCFDAAEGKTLWQDKYPANVNVRGPAGSFPGPRSSPAVADGKVVTLDEGATVSCLDAATGKVLWRKDFTKDFRDPYPGFYTAMSPLVVDGLCVVHLGGHGQGSILGLDLKSGETKWKWDGDGPAYASPVVVTVDGKKQVVQETEKSIVGLSLADGKLLWQTPFGGGGMGGGRGPGGGGQGGRGPGGPGGGGGRGFGPGGGGGGGGRMGGGRSYNAATPVVMESTVIVTSPGTGTKALKIQKAGDGYEAKEAWTNPAVGAEFNTPVLKDGLLYGVSGGGTLFCLDAKTGKTLWTGTDRLADRGYGTLVAAGPVLIALAPSGELTVFKPSEKAYEEVAKLKVANSDAYGYPVVAGNRLFVKDRDAVMMYSIK